MKVELTNDDCHNGDDMQVWLWRVVRATVKAMKSPKPAIAEREVWGHVRQGFELRQLQPIDPDNGRSIAGPGHLAEGVVTFAALSEWGRIKGYEFQMTIPDDDTVNGYADSRAREILLNGAAIDWQYWTGRMPKLDAPDAARLLSGLDPDKFPNLNEKPGHGNPAEAIGSARKIQKLAKAQGMNEAAPSEWSVWARENKLPVFPGFMLPLLELSDVEGSTVKVGAGGTAKAATLQDVKAADWRDKARELADECFDHDTTNNCRDSLVRSGKRGIAGGYAYRVMVLMQERGIHGPRGRIDNPATVAREALQGDKWWAKKSK